MKIVLVSLIALMLVGCSGMQPGGHYRMEGPTAVLLTQAEEQERAGDYDKAIASVERAVRIEPRNAYAWYRLAQLHFAIDSLAKAEQFARRAIQFAGDQRRLVSDSERLIDAIHLKRQRQRDDGYQRL